MAFHPEGGHDRRSHHEICKYIAKHEKDTWELGFPVKGDAWRDKALKAPEIGSNRSPFDKAWNRAFEGAFPGFEFDKKEAPGRLPQGLSTDKVSLLK